MYIHIIPLYYVFPVPISHLRSFIGLYCEQTIVALIKNVRKRKVNCKWSKFLLNLYSIYNLLVYTAQCETDFQAKTFLE